MHIHQPLRHIRPLLGAHVEIITQAPSRLNERAVRLAFAEIDSIHRLMNFHDVESDLSRINLMAWKRPVSISPSTLRILCFARQMARQSTGLFDYSQGGHLVRMGDLPDHGFPDLFARDITALVFLPRLRVRLRSPVVIYLDDLVRGYAIDQAVQILITQGVTRGVVKAGTELRLFGKDEARVHLRESNGNMTTLGSWSNTAMSTSALGLSVDSAQPTPRCMSANGGCDERACPHFQHCPHAWSTVVSCETWRASSLKSIAQAIPLKERAERIAQLGGHLLASRTDSAH
jgi:thiamine biosynthesis lipoprotein